MQNVSLIYLSKCIYQIFCNNVFVAMFYSDYFPKVLDCDQKIVKAVLAYLEDPDAPEGTAFVRYLAVRCFVGDTIKWSEMI